MKTATFISAYSRLSDFYILTHSHIHYFYHPKFFWLNSQFYPERLWRRVASSPLELLFVCVWVLGYVESFSVGLRRRLSSIHLKTVQRLQTRLGQRSALNRDGHCLLAGWAQRPMKMQSKQTAQPIGSLLQCLY